ncbi:MAG: D-alanyl-D-alanine carboxypeptidase/D-alanyl-D-alanine-endopeptidase [Bacteroidota bacterium]
MYSRLKRYGLGLLLWALPLIGRAAQSAAIVDAIKEAQSKKLFQTASIGCYAVNLAQNKVIVHINEKQSLIPASSLKLLTTAAAMEMLGKDFQFETTIQCDGQVDEQGTLHGNIYIRGGGDPALGSQQFRQHYYQPDFISTWVKAIQAKGIKKIVGAVVGDECIYTEEMVPATWAVGNLASYYGAGASGLSIFDNLCTVRLRAGQAQHKATLLSIVPALPPTVPIINQVQGAAIEHRQIQIKSLLHRPARILEGKIPCSQTISLQVTNPDPAYWAAYSLQQALQKQGIEITKSPSTLQKKQRSAKKRQTLFTTLSPPLWQIIKVINHDSLNGYTEHLLKHLSLAIGCPGNTARGTKALKQFWKDRGVDVTGMLLHDGSGFSKYNAVTPKQLVEVLRYMKANIHSQTFYQSLPIAGKTGTLAGLFQQPPLKGQLRAKSAALSGIRGFAGYYTNQAGDEVAFVLLVNHYDGSRMTVEKELEKILKVMVSQK